MDRRIIDKFIVLLNLKIGKDCITSVWVWHNPPATIYKSLIIKLFENIPNWLHEVEIHSLIIVLKVNPSAKTTNNLFPLSRVTHNYISATLIVLFNSHLHYLPLMSNLQLFIDLVLHWQTVAVPPEPSLNIVACLGGISTNHIFNSTSCYMTVMWSACRERRSIVERIWRKMLGFL